MGRLFSIACVCVAAAGLAGAEPPAVAPYMPAFDRCAGEILALHGVWLAGQTYLPVFGDMQLVEYLASLRGAATTDGQPGPAIVPVYSSNAIHFRNRNIVFLSTGFILRAGSERELTAAVQLETRHRPAPKRGVQSVALPGCVAPGAAAPAGFADVRLRLAVEVAEYQDFTTPRLRRREEIRSEPPPHPPEPRASASGFPVPD